MTRRRAAAALFAASVAGVSAAPLDSFNVDPAGTTVSGLSSGGYMANQFHVAYSSVVRGAAILAAGPFYCAKGNVATALTDCTTPGALNPPDPAYSIRVTEDYAARGEIDSPSYLRDSRVWLFSGTLDATVYPVVVERLHQYYGHYVDPRNIAFERTVPAAHAMVTDDYGHPCAHAGNGDNPNDIFINNCGYDAAGKLLTHLYGALKPPGAIPAGRIVEFDQGEFLADPTAHSMNPTGYAFVPDECDEGAPCRVHVAFHGCRQQVARIGERFYRYSGYNEWAEANRLIVLYPQATNSDLPPVYNPRGCWDWWGYDDPGYAKRSGRQMAAVKAMLDRLSSGYNPAPPAAPTLVDAHATSDTSVRLGWTASPGPRLARYNIYLATSAQGPFSRAGDTTGTQATLAGLLSGTRYYFLVRAESRRGAESPDSNVREATTTGLPPLPGALTPAVALVP